MGGLSVGEIFLKRLLKLNESCYILSLKIIDFHEHFFRVPTQGFQSYAPFIFLSCISM